MHYPVPSYLVPYVLGGTLAVVATVLFGLHRALKLAGWPARDRRQAVGIGALLLLAWFLAALSLSWFGLFHGEASRIPTIQYGLLIPIVAGVALYWRWDALKRVIETVPQRWIVSVQVYRVLGFIFLVLYAGGRMPGVFALPAGTGDTIVGLLAPVAAIAYARRSRNAGLMRAWNRFGLLDLFVAVTTGMLTSPSPLQLFAFRAPNELISAFPLAMVPVFLVPLWVLLHLASLKKLQEDDAVAGASVPPFRERAESRESLWRQEKQA